MSIDCCALIGLGSYTELRVFLIWNWFLVLILLLVDYSCESARTMNQKPISYIIALREFHDKRPTVSLKYSWAFVYWSPNLLWGF